MSAKESSKKSITNSAKKSILSADGVKCAPD